MYEANLTNIAGALAEISEEAFEGRVSWGQVCEVYLRAFPGCYVTLINKDIVTQRIEFIEHTILSSNFVDSFVNYYSAINPWNDIWKNLTDGECFIRSKYFPISDVEDSEFFSDWMSKIGDYYSATGVKVNISSSQRIFLTLHYPTSLSEKYDELVPRVSLVHSQLLERIAISNTQSADQLIAVSSDVSLIGLENDIVFVLDDNMNIIKANKYAEEQLQEKKFFRCRISKFYTVSPSVTEKLKKMVRSLANSATVTVSKACFLIEDAPWLVTFGRLPTNSPNLIAVHKRLVRVKFRRLDTVQQSDNFDELRKVFNLSLSETKLCECLYLGKSLSETAELLNWTYETARSNIKIVFQKTGQRKQADLIRLLERFMLS